MYELQDARDFYWWKVSKDLSMRETLRHIGEPEEYPCKVDCKILPDDTRSCPSATTGFHSFHTCTHTFFYRHPKTCPTCGELTIEGYDI